MHIIRVQDSYSDQEFYQFPGRLYRSNEYWVRPAEQEVRRVFQTEENRFFEESEVCRWIIQNYRGATIGRIAAFVDRSAVDAQGYCKGSLGFFECIDHQQAAFRLLEEGIIWLQSQRVGTLTAPINPTSLFLKSGLLTQGFDNVPVYGSNYHPAYYQGFFEEFEFKRYYRQQTYRCAVKKLSLPPSMLQKAREILDSPDYRIANFSKERLSSMAKNIALVYNQTWQAHPSYRKLSEQQIQQELSDLLPWIDENIFLLAYHQNQPIGFFFNLPNINQVRKQVGAGLFRKIREAYFRNGKHKNLLSVLLGVLPGYQKQGIGSALIQKVISHVSQSQSLYDEIETNRVSDNNPAMQTILKSVACEPHHCYWVYRKQLPVQEDDSVVPNNQSAVLK